MAFDGIPGLFALFSGLGVIAWRDYKERVILNGELIFLFAVRAFFLLPACLGEGGAKRALSCAAGFLMGGGVFFICYLFFREGLGAGDVKLFAVLGWWTGKGRILQAVFLTAAAALCWCVPASLVRRERLREGIPLAPFALLGTLGAYLWEIQEM